MAEETSYQKLSAKVTMQKNLSYHTTETKLKKYKNMDVEANIKTQKNQAMYAQFTSKNK